MNEADKRSWVAVGSRLQFNARARTVKSRIERRRNVKEGRVKKEIGGQLSTSAMSLSIGARGGRTRDWRTASAGGQQVALGAAVLPERRGSDEDGGGAFVFTQRALWDQ